MNLSTIIPNYMGAHLLQEQMPNVLKNVAAYGLVTVVDDASRDNSVEMLRCYFPSVNLIARETNGGFSAAVNDGIRATSGEFVVLLNNDVKVSDGFLDAIMPLFDDKQVFSVSPRILLPSLGNIDEAAKTGFLHHGMFYTDQRQGVESVSSILYTTGCAAVYRRSMLEVLGGFDEAYSPFYWEDVDLGYRAWKRGWKSLYQPASTVYHQHSASISRIKADYTGRIKARNSLFFIWRNIDDPVLLTQHRRWLPFVLARRVVARDWAFVRGWREAFRLKEQAIDVRVRDSAHRVLSDREILDQAGVVV